jgi:hypothetical protein
MKMQRLNLAFVVLGIKCHQGKGRQGTTRLLNSLYCALEC